MDRILISLERVRNRFTYWSPAIDKVRLIESDLTKTMGIDQLARIYYNPKFVNRCNDAELEAVVEHEINHYVRGHHFRWVTLLRLEILKDTKEDHKKFNIAADLEINCDIPNLPPMALHPTRFKLPVGLVLEEYLKHKLDSSMDIDSSKGVGAGDIILDDSANLEQAEAIWKEVDSEIGSLIGSGSNGYREKIRYNPVKYNWKSVLRNVVGRIVAEREQGSDQSTYAEINRRMSCIPKVLYPHQYDESRVIKLLFAVDTSGSMHRFLNKIFSHILSLKKTYESEDTKILISLIQLDDVIQSHTEDIDKMPDLAIGLGGTDMRELFKYLYDNKLNYDFIILGTDGATPWPKNPLYHNKTIVLMTEDDYHNCPYKWYRI